MPAVPRQPAVAAQPVEEAGFHQPLYDIPNNYSQNLRAFTVVIAGPERVCGVPPYAYVVEDYSTEKAWAKALAWFMADQETPDAYVIAAQSFEGVPEPGTCLYTDLRSEFIRLETLNDLADQATEAVDSFNAHTAELIRDNNVIPHQQSAYDTALRKAALVVWPLVVQLAENGR